MPRDIDHLVIAARDLDAQAAFYRRLGFQVGARNRHPWGTENHIIQFGGSFLELIGLGEGFAAPPPAPCDFSFARFIARFLEEGQGIAMLAMRSPDAEADRAAFARAGLGDFARFDFARKGRRADGGETEVAFSLSYASTPALPRAGFFVCQQHFPENFWNAALQVHANGARAIAGVALAHERPEDIAGFLASLTGAKAQRVEGGLAFTAGGATLEALTPRAIGERYGVAAPLPGAPPLALVRIRVADLAATCAALARGAIPFAPRPGAAIVATRDAFGATLVFEP
jgi:catechol 2,3-dioxygenase-like lactoylglutathione lyase family enzyme